MRIVRTALVGIVVCLNFVVLAGGVHAVDGLPAGFSFETVASGFNQPVAMSFASDGRIFVAEKGGAVRIVKNGSLLATPFITLTDVNSPEDRGLIGIALDPNFTNNNFVYLAYTYESNPADAGGYRIDNNLPGCTGITNDSVNVPANCRVISKKTARVVRVTANGDTAVTGSENVILGTLGGTPDKPSCADYPAGSDCLASDSGSHTIGGMRFGQDGKLYIATGDGAGFFAVDDHAFRSQDLDHLSGKILRINTDGTAPTDNPFYTGNPNDNRSKVWAYGLRNPYRFNFHPETGKAFGGDVGWGEREEVNYLEAGKNYGWPCREGILETGGYNVRPGCPIATATAEPIYDYSHAGQTSAITGGAFALSSTYPDDIRGSYIFADVALNFMRTMQISQSNTATSVNDFATDLNFPVEIVTGPDGSIYYLALFANNGLGDMRKLVYSEENLDEPVARIAITNITAKSPYIATFSAESSTDSLGEDLTYTWNFGDGSIGVGPVTSHTYAAGGLYEVTLTVTTPRGASDATRTTVNFIPPDDGGTIAQPFVVATELSPSVKYFGSEINLDFTIGNSREGDPFIVFFEITDEAGNIVKKEFYQEQTITQGSQKDYSFDWTPLSAGTHYVSIGFFGKEFATVIEPYLYKTLSFDVVRRTPDDPEEPTLESQPFVIDGTFSQERITGQEMQIDVNVGNTLAGKPFIVAFFIYDDSGEIVGNTYFSDQTIATSSEELYTMNWTPDTAGSYYLSAGLFSNDWSEFVTPWTHSVVAFDVTQPSIDDPEGLCLDEGNGDAWGFDPTTNLGCWIGGTPDTNLCLDNGAGQGVRPDTGQSCTLPPV